MKTIPMDSAPMSDPNRRLTDLVRREGDRLARFIRSRVADPGDAEDILQDVLFELVEASRLPEPIERVGAWLRRVAVNRITDWFRRKRPLLLDDLGSGDVDEPSWQDLLPAADGDPETALLRSALLDELAAALAELPAAQRRAFVAHEIDGIAFKDLAAREGVGVNTLLSRKRAAVLHLRRRLRAAYDDILER